MAADMYQTSIGTARCWEDNPIIGNCGQNVPVGIYFPITTAATLFASYYMNEWRSPFLGVITGVEVKTIYYNYQELK